MKQNGSWFFMLSIAESHEAEHADRTGMIIFSKGTFLPASLCRIVRRSVRKIFRETTFEVISRQTLRHHRGPKDEREPRRSLLERPERNRVLSTSHTFASGGGDRPGAPAKQPVLGDPPIRTGPSPYAWGSLAIFSHPAPGEAANFRSVRMLR
jgi:hypothetical protein